MTDQTDDRLIERRKADHIRINLEEDVQFPHLTTGLERYRFMHRALPELDLDAVDTRITLFGKTLNAPILISSMTGGTSQAGDINRILAEAAEATNIAVGVGSQRAAIVHPDLAASFHMRDVAPKALLFANVGAVQLNYGFTIDQYRKSVDMIGADALILHFNALQEAVQPEGDVNFAGLLPKIEALVKAIGVPVIAKEVGWGFSEADARALAGVGIAAFDVAGAGGTSWSEVEYYRAHTDYHRHVARAFADWGIPTAESIGYVKAAAPDLPIIASGGLRGGVDIAKCIALGASMGGMAGPFLKAAVQSVEAVIDLIRATQRVIQIAMFCAGAADVPALQRTPLLRV